MVSIGTGVSLLLVTGPGRDQFRRVSGSTIGGGTYLGLCKLLIKAHGFEDLLEMAGRGRNEKVRVDEEGVKTRRSEATKLKHTNESYFSKTCMLSLHALLPRSSHNIMSH